MCEKVTTAVKVVRVLDDITGNTLPDAMFETAVDVTSGVDVSGYHHSDQVTNDPFSLGVLVVRSVCFPLQGGITCTKLTTRRRGGGPGSLPTA